MKEQLIQQFEQNYYINFTLDVPVIIKQHILD